MVRYMFVYCQDLSTLVSLEPYNGIVCFRRLSVGHCHILDMPGVVMTATIAFIASPSANLPWWVLRIVRGSVRVAPTKRGDINIYATRVMSQEARADRAGFEHLSPAPASSRKETRRVEVDHSSTIRKSATVHVPTSRPTSH